MGTPGHLAFETLSALADGELDRAERSAAMEHLVECAGCARAYEGIGALDALLRQPTAVSCEAALPLLSAALDHEADPAEMAVARAHIASCAACAQSAKIWTSADLQLRAMPFAAPSARVDRAIVALAGRSPRQIGLRIGLPRVALATITAALLLVGSFYRAAPPAAPVSANGDNGVLVAAVQQVVFNSKTNTLYVLDGPAAAVYARDATTNQVQAKIDVGGRPTALALNESANTVLVLDASQKKVTEIDGTTNKVLSSATVATAGTPTSISVDPASSKIVVATSDTKTNAASVAVLDATTKQVESVRDVSVGAVAMVFDSSGERAVLVSPSQTTVVDSNYKIITTLPGGVSAAFGQGDERIAVLSASGLKSIVTYAGRGAPIPLELPGSPRAIRALPDGGFLVLVELDGKSRVSHVAPDGHELAHTDVNALGQDLLYDAKSQRFSVLGREGVASADVPTAAVVAASPSPSAPPTVSAQPSPSASSSANPQASPSASPSVEPSQTPIVAVAPTRVTSFEHLDLPGGRAPILVSKNGETLWVLDDRNGVVKVDMASGHMDFITLLPRDSHITYLAAGRRYVYLVDSRAAAVHLIDTTTGKTSLNAVLFIKPVSSVVVGGDDHLWLSLTGISYLLSFDPLVGRTTAYDLSAHISKVAIDQHGRVVYADDDRSTVGVYDPVNARLSEFRLARHGSSTGLVVDVNDTIWLSTSAGEIYSYGADKLPRLALGLQRPVTALSLDANGFAWYLAPLASGEIGYGYATTGGAEHVAIGGPASSLEFSALGRAWLADPRGGFYVSRSDQ